jgi:hypothetical protein
VLDIADIQGMGTGRRAVNASTPYFHAAFWLFWQMNGFRAGRE